MKHVWVKSATCAVTASTTARRGVADGRHGDAGAEVDELVPVDVDDDAARALADVDRQGADAGGDRRRLALVESAAAGRGSRSAGAAAAGSSAVVHPGGELQYRGRRRPMVPVQTSSRQSMPVEVGDRARPRGPLPRLAENIDRDRVAAPQHQVIQS